MSSKHVKERPKKMMTLGLKPQFVVLSRYIKLRWGAIGKMVSSGENSRKAQLSIAMRQKLGTKRTAESIFEACNSLSPKKQIFKKYPFSVFLLERANNTSINVSPAAKQMILPNVSLY